MAGKDESRLSRWSRVKRDRAAGREVAEPEAPASAPVRGGGAAPTVAPTPEDDAGLPAPADAGLADERPLTPEEEEAVAALPPIDELTAESDFAPFLSDKIPEFIQRRALRKLWLSDPAFSFLDGMNEYDEDYSIIAELASNASAYRPGKGYLTKEPAEAEDEADADAGETIEAPAAANAGPDVRTPDLSYAHPVYQAPTGPGLADNSSDDDDDLGEAEDDSV